MSQHRAKLFQVGLLSALLTCCCGCQWGRSWFHMDSNSSIPFFGFDLLSVENERLVPLAPDEAPIPHVAGAPSRVRTVADRSKKASRSLILELPPLQPPFTGVSEEDVTLTGPTSAFVR